jgi:hypothetical protein
VDSVAVLVPRVRRAYRAAKGTASNENYEAVESHTWGAAMMACHAFSVKSACEMRFCARTARDRPGAAGRSGRCDAAAPMPLRLAGEAQMAAEAPRVWWACMDTRR